ncbi:MAG: hypothetical protein K5924_03670 [Chloroflexi bacterium]|nr:hypothetical protein [Chloroflexota bacterium]
MPVDVVYVSGDLRQSVEIPGCSRIVVSVPRAEHWSLVIDDIPAQSSRDGGVRELRGTITLPMHFDSDSRGFDAPFLGAPDSADPRMGTEC